MYKEEYYDYSGKEGKWIKDELKKRGFHHATISNFPADFFRMSKSQLEKLFERASDAFIARMYDVPQYQVEKRRGDFGIKQLGCTLNRMEREEETAQIFKEILRIVSNEYNNGNFPHTNSTPLNSEKEFLYMKATGIVRRIDDLGRVVIPKEIRRTLHIKEGDPLEIYTAKDGEVIFKKYSPIGDMGQFAEEYCATLQTVSGFPCAITDKEMVVAASGKSKTVGKALSREFEQLLERRRPYRAESDGPELTGSGDSEVALAHPIMAEGDIAGMVTMLRSPGKEAGDAEDKLLHAAAIFLGKQLES